MKKDNNNNFNASPLAFFNKNNKGVFKESNDENLEFIDNPNEFSDSLNSPNTHEAFGHAHVHHDHCDCDECTDHKHSEHKMYDLDEDFDENEDYFCDIDPSKICDNCGKCLDYYNTDKNGYVEIPIDKVDTSNNSVTLDDLLKLYGLDDDSDQ